MKHKAKAKRNNQSFNDVTRLPRKNSYQENPSSFMAMELYEMLNKGPTHMHPQAITQYNDWIPTTRNRNGSTFSNNQKELSS